MTVNVAFSPTLHTHRVNIILQAMFTLAQERRNLQFKGYGFKLNVPESNLPAEISEIQLNVQVSLSGQFQMPLDCYTKLFSAVYLVYSPTSSPSPSLLR